MKKGKDGKLIFINILEYITVLINYAASIVAINEIKEREGLSHEYPVILIRADNTTAESWAKKASHSSKTGKAIMR
jgi:hypothetical protein